MNQVLLTELSRLRQRDIARDVALCRQTRSPRIFLGRALVAVGACVVLIGAAIDDESDLERQSTLA